MSLFIEIPKDYADAFKKKHPVFTAGDKYFVAVTARELYPDELMLKTAPEKDLVDVTLMPYL